MFVVPVFGDRVFQYLTFVKPGRKSEIHGIIIRKYIAQLGPQPKSNHNIKQVHK